MLCADRCGRARPIGISRPASTNSLVKYISGSPFGFWIANFRLSERDFEGTAFIGLVLRLLIQNRKSKMLFDHFICPLQHVDRNGQANLFRGLKVDDEFKLRRLLHRQISGLGAFQDLVDVNSSPPIEVFEVRPLRHETAGFHKVILKVNSRHPVFDGKLDDALSFSEKRASALRHNSADLLLLCGLKGAL
jgi:hypothetical protein